MPACTSIIDRFQTLNDSPSALHITYSLHRWGARSLHTMEKVCMMVDPKAFMQLFVDWMRDVVAQINNQEGDTKANEEASVGDVVPIDSRTFIFLIAGVTEYHQTSEESDQVFSNVEEEVFVPILMFRVLNAIFQHVMKNFELAFVRGKHQRVVILTILNHSAYQAFALGHDRSKDHSKCKNCRKGNQLQMKDEKIKELNKLLEKNNKIIFLCACCLILTVSYSIFLSMGA